jgi:hypothetical protein
MSFQALSLNAPQNWAIKSPWSGCEEELISEGLCWRLSTRKGLVWSAVCQCLESEANTSFPAMNGTTACCHRDR